MKVSTIGLDIAKHVFQIHGVDENEVVVLRKKLRRSELLSLFSQIGRCLIGIEACATAHHWARELASLGHQVKLIPASYVKTYVKRSKNDAADAEAICEAVTRPSIARSRCHRARDCVASSVCHAATIPVQLIRARRL
jgi:transposase